MEQVLCCGPQDGKQQTFVLLDEHVPRTEPLQPEEALEQLALRYFRGHGPATQQDLMRWAGLNASEAKRAIASAGQKLVQAKLAGATYYLHADHPPPAAANTNYLLPAFDEYILGYKDRGDILAAEHTQQVFPGGGVFRATIVRDGRVVGTWKAQATTRQVRVTTQPFTPLSAAARSALKTLADRYGDFLGRTAVLL